MFPTAQIISYLENGADWVCRFHADFNQLAPFLFANGIGPTILILLARSKEFW